MTRALILKKAHGMLFIMGFAMYNARASYFFLHVKTSRYTGSAMNQLKHSIYYLKRLCIFTTHHHKSRITM